MPAGLPDLQLKLTDGCKLEHRMPTGESEVDPKDLPPLLAAWLSRALFDGRRRDAHVVNWGAVGPQFDPSPSVPVGRFCHETLI